MSGRRWMSLPMLAGAIAFVGACADAPVAPSPLANVVEVDRVAVVAVPNTSHFTYLTGQLWVCADGNLPGSGFSYKYTVWNKATMLVAAKGVIRGLNIGECAMAVQMPTTGHTHYLAVVKQDAPDPFSFAHGIFEFGAFYPATPPASTADLANRTMTSGLSSDGGVVMTFYNNAPLPN